MNTGLEFVKKQDILEEIKSSGLSNPQQIREYKEYLLNDKNFRFPFRITIYRNTIRKYEK